MPESRQMVESHPVAHTPPGIDAHPRGTLAIVLVFGILFALGWLAVYLLVFLERGVPHP